MRGGPARRILPYVLLCAALWTVPEGALAQQISAGKPKPDASDQLKATKKRLDAARGKSQALEKKAQDLEEDIVRIRDGLVAAARIIQHHEQRIGELESRLEELRTGQEQIQDRFRSRRNQLGKVLAALQRMARNPPEALIAQPIPPADMVRSAILLRSVLPRLEGEARVLAENLAALAAARSETETRRSELDGELGKLEEQRAVLKRLLGRKSRLRRRTVVETTRANRKMAQLANRAASLQELVTRLDQLRNQPKAPVPTAVRPGPGGVKRPVVAKAPTVPVRQRVPKGFSGKPFESGKGRLPFPVVGRVIARYGQNIASGRIHKGLTMETTAQAQVIAPFEGKVVFSGPFRGYGQLLIIEHTGGYHTLLAGMARIDATVGQWLLVGEPVGIMGQAKQVSTKGRRRVQRPALYVEFRRKGQPIDPLAWLADRKGKLSG